MCMHVCVHKHALRKMGQGYGREKGPHLISSPPSPPHIYASPNWILYYRSSQVWTTHFPLPLVAFSFLFLTFLLRSFLVFLSVCLSITFYISFLLRFSFCLPSLLPSALFLILLLWTLFSPSSSVKVSGRLCPWLGERYSGQFGLVTSLYDSILLDVQWHTLLCSEVLKIPWKAAHTFDPFNMLMVLNLNSI